MPATLIRPGDRTAPTGTDWTIKRLLRKGGVGVLWGPPGGGKSTILVDLLGHIATGRTWRDRRVCPGPCVVVAAEDAVGVNTMITAWERHHETGAPVYVVEGVHDLEAQSGEVVALVAKVKDEAGEPVAVVAIDTFAAAWPHGESNDDMAAFLGCCRLLADITGAAVLVVHHPGHDGGRERGGSALRAGVDLSLGAERSGERGTLTAAKVRGAPDGMTWGYQLDVVDFGRDAEGDLITATVAVEAAAPPAGAPKLTNNEVIVLRALVMAASFSTAANGGSHVVDLERWRGVAYRLMPAENLDSKRKGFNRAREALVRKGYVHCLDDRYSVAPDLALPPDFLRTSEQVARTFN